MKHLDSYISEKTGKQYALERGKGYRRGCRCEACVGAYREKKVAERERRLAKAAAIGIPADVHGTWNGYCNYGCRCQECLQALRDTTYGYSAEYRELNRERINSRRRHYYYEVKAAEEAQDLKRKGK